MPFSLLSFQGLPILQQLQLEETLLRTEQGNWCLINTEAPDAIVLGISGKAEQLLDMDQVQQKKIPLIRRYSGGGTVYIDAQTIFVTLIGEGAQTPHPLLAWGAHLYAPLFPPHFSLRENDYVIQEHKVGGNAQYLQRNRWVHHTSFLWDFNAEKMECLRLPEKRPAYRQARSHAHFLTPLSAYFPSKQQWLNAFINHLQTALPAHPTSIDLEVLLQRPCRRSSHILLT